MSKHIPGAGKKPIWKKKWLGELIASVPPITMAIIAVFRASIEGQPEIGWLAGSAVLWIIVASLWRIVAAKGEDKEEEPEVVHEGLYASVSTLHAILLSYCKRQGLSDDLRATFHRVVPPVNNPKKIEQVIPYVGWGTGGAGRMFSVNTGITGHAIRTRTPTTMSSFALTEEEYRSELMSEWGYTREEAWSLASRRHSAVAIPVLDSSRQQAVGVLYLDSSDRELFDNEGVSQILGVGSKAISDFVTRRYI